MILKRSALVVFGAKSLATVKSDCCVHTVNETEHLFEIYTLL